MLGRLVRRASPATSLEIGMAYGVSTLYICEALSALAHPARHIVVDPFQSTQWRGIGLRNIAQAGFASLVDFHETRSELLLPRLLESATSIQFAFIDGWHTFDQVMVEMYYVNRLLEPGGIVVFDDADRRSVNRAIRYFLNYPNYEVIEAVRPPVSVAGRLRRGLARIPGVERILRTDLLHRDWDLGVSASCVALRKTGPDDRSSGWYRDF